MLPLFLILPVLMLAQKKEVEIFGKITGEYKNNIYLFYDNNFATKDSFSAAITNGKFYIKTVAELPILCRIHFGDNSNIQEFYIDGSKTTISLLSTLTNKSTPDSLGGASTRCKIVSVKGSKTDNIVRSFEAWNLKSSESNQSIEQKHSSYFDKLLSIVTMHPKSKASAYIIAGKMYIVGQAFMFRGEFPLSYSELYQLSRVLDTSLKNTLEWQNITKLLSYLDNERHRTVGTAFYDVALKDTSDKDVGTKSFRNKYVLIYFWASWCVPCRASNPQLRLLYAKYKDRGFEIVGVSIDEDKKAWKKAIIKDALRWTQLIESKGTQGTLCKYYDITGVPEKILLDKEGKIVGFDLSTEEVEDYLKKAL